MDGLLRPWRSVPPPPVWCETDRTSPPVAHPRNRPRATRTVPAYVHSIAERSWRRHASSAAPRHPPSRRCRIPHLPSASSDKRCEGSLGMTGPGARHGCLAPGAWHRADAALARM